MSDSNSFPWILQTQQEIFVRKKSEYNLLMFLFIDASSIAAHKLQSGRKSYDDFNETRHFQA